MVALSGLPSLHWVVVPRPCMGLPSSLAWGLVALFGLPRNLLLWVVFAFLLAMSAIFSGSPVTSFPVVARPSLFFFGMWMPYLHWVPRTSFTVLALSSTPIFCFSGLVRVPVSASDDHWQLCKSYRLIRKTAEMAMPSSFFSFQPPFAPSFGSG